MLRIRIWIIISPSKKSKKNLDSYCFVTSFWLFIFENDIDVPSKSNKPKNFFFKFAFCWHRGKVNDENSRIRIRMAWIRGSRSGSTPNVMDPQHWKKGSRSTFVVILKHWSWSGSALKPVRTWNSVHNAHVPGLCVTYISLHLILYLVIWPGGEGVGGKTLSVTTVILCMQVVMPSNENSALGWLKSFFKCINIREFMMPE